MPPHVYINNAVLLRSTFRCTPHCCNLAVHTCCPIGVCVKTEWRAWLPMPCDVDFLQEMLPPQMLVREWGITWWQVLLYPWWCHQASFSLLWHHHSLLWLAGSLSVMPPSGNFFHFVPFLSAKRSWVITSGWTFRPTGCVFFFLFTGHYMHWTCPFTFMVLLSRAQH